MIAALVLLVMLVGLLGVLLPVIPGLILIWGAALGYGLVQGFGSVGIVAMVILTAVLIAGMGAAFIIPTRATQSAGAAPASIWIGVAAAIVGFFVIPVFGLIIGGVLGVYVAEWQRSGDRAAAQRTTLATLKGFGLGALIQFLAGIAMILTWGVWVLIN